MSEYLLDKDVAEIRSNDFAISTLILNRWSPRSFLTKKVAEEDMLAVLDAARWAPSCFNEQPWRFIVARKHEALKMMQQCLVEKNQEWANNVPVLITIISNPNFNAGGKANRWHAFDAGAAWGYLALEAKARGLIAHAMGGFSKEKIHKKFSVPEDWGIHAVVALGYQGPSENLSEDTRDKEHPTKRNPLHELWVDGKFKFK